METSKNRKDYAVFHKFLIKNGFIMMQKSVYSKLVVNGVTIPQSLRAVKERVEKNLPPEGIVELLEVTENQFSKIDYLVGENQNFVEESMDRIVEI